MKKIKQKLTLLIALSACLMISACNTRTGIDSDDNSPELNNINSSETYVPENSHKLTFPNKSSNKSADTTDDQGKNNSEKNSTSLTMRSKDKNTSKNSNDINKSKNSSHSSTKSNDSSVNNRLSSSTKTSVNKEDQDSEGKFNFTEIKIGRKNLTLPFSTKDLVDLGYESTKTGELEQYSYALDVPFINSEANEDIVTVNIINLEEKARPVESAPVYSITINNYGIFSNLKLANGINFNSSKDEIINAHANKYNGVAQISNSNNETIIKFKSTENPEVSIEYTLLDSKLIRIKITTDKFLATQ